MELTRTLKKGTSGADVRYAKDMLYALGYLTVQPSHNTFGSDTEKAVRAFQAANTDAAGARLDVDGLIGQKTWAALESRYDALDNGHEQVLSILNPADYPNIAPAKIIAIGKELAAVSPLARSIVAELLGYAYDYDVGGDMRALYCWAANLYTDKLTLNEFDAEKLEKQAARYPSYFNAGRKEMMLAAIQKGEPLPGADCSGGIVGLLRKHRLVSNTFDTTANSLCGNSHSSAVPKSSLRPGDWVGSDKHIGTVVGAGYAVEFVAGAYGCQITSMNNRKIYNQVDKKLQTGKAWTKFRRPKYY